MLDSFLYVQDLPLHTVCVCEVDTHANELQLCFSTVLSQAAALLPQRQLPNTAEIVRMTWAKLSSEKLSPKGNSRLAGLAHLTEVPRTARELEATLDFAGTLVIISRCMRDSVWCAPSNGAHSLAARLAWGSATNLAPHPLLWACTHIVQARGLHFGASLIRGIAGPFLWMALAKQKALCPGAPA